MRHPFTDQIEAARRSSHRTDTLLIVMAVAAGITLLTNLGTATLLVTVALRATLGWMPL